MSDDESTQEIDIDALRDSLAKARATKVSLGDTLGDTTEASESIPVVLDADETKPPDDDNVDLADVEDVIEEGEPDDATRVGNLPGQEVALALRAMMGDIPDPEKFADTSPEGMYAPPTPRTVDDGETQTKMPEPSSPPKSGFGSFTRRSEAMTATSIFGRAAEDDDLATYDHAPMLEASSFPDPSELPEADELPRFTLASYTSEETALDDAESMRLSGPDTREIAAHGARPSSPSLPAIDVRMTAPSLPAIDIPISETPSTELPEAEILEIESVEAIEDPQTFPHAAKVATTFQAPVAMAEAPSALENVDPEEQELLDERRFGPLIAVYKQRLTATDGPNKRAALFLKMAAVYENGLQDPHEAFEALAQAFELAPDTETIVTALDRVAKETGRVGELADRVKKKMLPGSPDDRRVLFLGHLVYWYEKVLGRGSEVSSFVSEIERLDKVHPVALKRAAQLAAMNGDAKTQREHLVRALERCRRREERVAIYLALASAHAGTADALRYYQAALENDPTSIVALQGVKRLGKEKENYPQVQWALERQAEVAPTEAERVDALLELAELQETRFLKREEAAKLLERVLEIEPSQPTAMKGLERCYHALREWPKLGRILTLRAEHTFDRKAKVELLELAAEVYEAKIGDPARAIDVYLNLLVVEPKHRRALGDLGRLYEKLGDWDNLATYKARLAELAPTKRASSQELVKLGDFLSAEQRAPELAKQEYERAVSIDPTNAAGWEALQRIAAEAGDEARVIECLEQRKKHTDVPRQRAAVLVELARVHEATGDETAARKCYEAAIRADSSNEAAAVEMLDAYTAEERWTDAAPLCELLVNAAIRDRDGEALFVRLRLATRIAAALGDVDRALTSAMAALDARPKDPGAQADLIAVASQCREMEGALQRAHEALVRVVEEAAELPTDQLVRLASLLRELGDLELAAETFEEIRTLDPENQEVTRELAEVYLVQGDFPRACKLKVDMARRSASGDVRFDLFCEAGEIWARRADELEKAATLFEEARAIKPLDPWLLQSMMWLYGELGEWGLLTGILDDMAQAAERPEDQIKHLVTMAELVRDKLQDRVRAADLYDRVLDIDKKRLDIFEELVRTLTEEKNWERLERAYRKMIARVKDDDEPQLQTLLFHQLGLIYRDRLGDAERAYDALDAASNLKPEDPEIRKMVVELLVVTDNLDNAVLRLREAIDRDPHDPQLYAELYELFLRQHAFDKAWCVVNVLSRLREPSADQRRFHEDYAPMPLDRVPGQIVEQAWKSHLFHQDLDPALTNIFALITPVVARMRHAQVRPDQKVSRPFTPNHSRMHDLIRATFRNAAEILAVPTPELLLGDIKSATPFAPALSPFGAVMVSGPAIEAQSVALIYLVGKRLAESRSELAARSFFPSVSELSSLLGTAVRVSRNEIAKDPAGVTLDQNFGQALTPQEASALRSVVLQATSESASLDVKKWAAAADLSVMRAGLLMCGDVEPARQAIMAEAAQTTELAAKLKVGELYKFATSDIYSDLRGAIGVSVQG